MDIECYVDFKSGFLLCKKHRTPAHSQAHFVSREAFQNHLNGRITIVPRAPPPAPKKPTSAPKNLSTRETCPRCQQYKIIMMSPVS